MLPLGAERLSVPLSAPAQETPAGPTPCAAGKAPEPGHVGRHCQRQPRADGRSGFADVGIVPDTQRGWVKQAGIDAGALPGMTTSDARTI